MAGVLILASQSTLIAKHSMLWICDQEMISSFMRQNNTLTGSEKNETVVDFRLTISPSTTYEETKMSCATSSHDTILTLERIWRGLERSVM